MAEQISDLAKAIAILGGVLVGIYAVWSPSWVWHRKQIFSFGAGVLCMFGTVLIVASMFRTISLSASPTEGMKVQFAELQKELAATRVAAEAAQKQLAAYAKINITTASSPPPELARMFQTSDKMNGQLNVLRGLTAKLSGPEKIQFENAIKGVESLQYALVSDTKSIADRWVLFVRPK